jgi:hypothetical protein
MEAVSSRSSRRTWNNQGWIALRLFGQNKRGREVEMGEAGARGARGRWRGGSRRAAASSLTASARAVPPPPPPPRRNGASTGGVGGMPARGGGAGSRRRRRMWRRRVRSGVGGSWAAAMSRRRPPPVEEGEEGRRRGGETWLVPGGPHVSEHALMFRVLHMNERFENRKQYHFQVHSTSHHRSTTLRISNEMKTQPPVSQLLTWDWLLYWTLSKIWILKCDYI